MRRGGWLIAVALVGSIGGDDPSAKTEPNRVRWDFEGGRYVFVGEGEWVRLQGTREENYREVARTPEYVEIARTTLVPARARVAVRLYDDRSRIRLDAAAFSDAQAGRWIDETGRAIVRSARDAVETINGIDVRVGDPQFTLTWDTRADLDLHVIEPGDSDIYWEVRKGNKGSELDVDDVDGFGPENVHGPLDKKLTGTYRFYVHYYGGFAGKSTPTRWKVRVKNGGRTETFEGKLEAIDSRSRQYSIEVP